MILRDLGETFLVIDETQVQEFSNKFFEGLDVNTFKIEDKKLFVKNKISNLYKFLVDKNYRDWKLNKEFHKLTWNDKTYHS